MRPVWLSQSLGGGSADVMLSLRAVRSDYVPSDFARTYSA
jgi:hypothetical protein